jgi:DNA-binding LacI/PurR family transcriptional regulator
MYKAYVKNGSPSPVPDNALPLYLQVKESIRKEVGEGRLKPGALLPREETLCRDYKVSPITIKRALMDLTREGLLMRIKSKGTFVNPKVSSGKSVSSRTTRKILSFIVPDIEDLFIHEIFQGVESVLSQAGYLVSVLSSGCNPSKEVGNLEFLKEGVSEGAIIFPYWGRANVERILELKKRGFPFVLIDRYYRDINTDMVVVDNAGGAKEAVRYLLSNGHKRIAHVMGVECTANEDRFEGYINALGEAGVPYDASLVRKIRPLETRGSVRFEPDDVGGFNETLALLKAKELPTAIFAGNDYLALGCLTALKEKGVRVPGDVSVVGFDDLRFAAQLEVPLTTVRQPKREIGKQAATLLLQTLARNKSESSKNAQVILKTELIVRQSSTLNKQGESTK